jgi:N-acetylneuraminic acid mutarotase
MNSKNLGKMSRGPNRVALTRRDVIVGVATAALLASSPAILAVTSRKSRGKRATATSTTYSLRRYMAACAVLGDGRLLVTGGYDKPPDKSSGGLVLNSALIFDPSRGQWFDAAPMAIPRARHAAVSLADGTVAVLGGLSTNPTASVEIYDPRTNTWSVASSLAHPRYDHCAFVDGSYVYVLGGIAQSVLSSIEVFEMGSGTHLPPRI